MVVGFILAVVLRSVEMERTLKSFLTGAVVIVTVLWALCQLHVACLWSH